MLVVNLWGAPGSGKSTTAAGLFFLLKINKWHVELVTEFAKDMVWERNESIFGDQVRIFAEQNRRLRRLDEYGGVDVAITDSPLPLPAFYQPKDYLAGFTPLVMEQFNRYHNVNYLLQRRAHSFEALGRRHGETQAVAIENDLRTFLDTHTINCKTVAADPYTPQVIMEDLKVRRGQAVDMPFQLDGLA